MVKGDLGRVMVVGASGLIGKSVVAALSTRAEVLEAHRSSSTYAVDLTDPTSIKTLFSRVGKVDSIICLGGMVGFTNWADVQDQDWANGLAGKLMGQVNLTRFGAPFVRDGGSIILTSGTLAQYPIPGSSIVTTVNAAVEGFVRAAAVEIERGVRVNAVSPGWVSETMDAIGMDSSSGLPAAEVAKYYINLLESTATGTVETAAKVQ